ncbi:hypothetical protein AOLI_G00040400 [Acnodon oligacanthus]
MDARGSPRPMPGPRPPDPPLPPCKPGPQLGKTRPGSGTGAGNGSRQGFVNPNSSRKVRRERVQRSRLEGEERTRLGCAGLLNRLGPMTRLQPAVLILHPLSSSPSDCHGSVYTPKSSNIKLHSFFFPYHLK